MSKAKARKTALDQIVTQLRTILRRETADVVLAGKLLIESRQHLKHGEWQPWLAENFDLSYRTAVNYCDAAEYAEQKCNVADFGNLAPTVLYALAAGHYNPEEEAAILAATHKGRVDQTRASAICDELLPPEPEEIEPDAADADADADADDDGDIDEAAEDPEITAILDGPPPDVLPAPPPSPPNFMLRKFDQAIAVLQRLMTRSSAQYANSNHNVSDLENVEGFIHAVADKVRKAKKESKGEEVRLPEPASRVS